MSQVLFTLRTSVGLAREEDRTPDTTPQKTLMTMVSSVSKETRDDIIYKKEKKKQYKAYEHNAARISQ